MRHALLACVLALAWGMCSDNALAQAGACCTDGNNDGIPDSCGILPQTDCVDSGGSFQGAGSTCIGTGACCFGITGGQCIELDGTCCSGLGGDFKGVGTSCFGDSDNDGFDEACEEQACCVLEAAVTCFMAPPDLCVAVDGTPMGNGTDCQGHESCCFGDGSCLFIDRLCCEALGGQAGGPGSTCQGDGACCQDFDDGPLAYDACDIVDGACCGGVFQGEGSDCGPVPCCLPGGFCQMAAPDCCIDSGGIPQDFGLDCGQVQCPDEGACCFDIDDGPLQYDTCGLLPGVTCETTGGLFVGADTTCQFGACCLPGGFCQETDVNCCLASGGAPQGGLSCDDLNCPAEIGACCFDVTDGPLEYETCTIMGQGLCEIGGIFQGTGTTCETEACCLPTGECIPDADPECCIESGGLPLGPASTCVGATCPNAVGACCVDIDDGPLQYDFCFEPTLEQCEANGGVFQGPGSQCDVRACCLPDGGCQEADRECCLASGGIPQNEPSCAAATCQPNVGACCLDIDDGPLQYDTCAVLGQELCEVGGVFQGVGTTCEVQACCLPDGFCQNADPQCCLDSGGTPAGPGTTCGSIVDCPIEVGACCFDFDDGPLAYDACEVLPRTECESSGGLFEGPGTLCSMEACCLPGPFCQDTDPQCCVASGGLPQGPGSSCDALPVCPIDLTGACCFDSNDDGFHDSCEVTTTDVCAGVEGVFRGPGTVCQGRGACCFGITGGLCLQMDGTCCDMVAGSFQLGQDCLGDIDGNTLDDACEVIPCDDKFDCADRDGDGIRETPCVWWACPNGVCRGRLVRFADMGGNNGACPPDNTADNNDLFHTLNCFSNQNTLANGPYACEDDPPMAANVDVAGLGAPCGPDGVCDGNDTFAALFAFSGTTTCVCPMNLGGAPAPQAKRETVAVTLALESAPSIQPDGLLEVQVLLADALPNLLGYQLHVDVSGGVRGQLELVDLAVQPTKTTAAATHVFAGLPYWSAFNLRTQQMVVGLSADGVAARAGMTLATLTLRASPDASGTFHIGLRHDRSDPRDRSVLFSAPHHPIAEIRSSRAATVRVTAKRRRARTR